MISIISMVNHRPILSTDEFYHLYNRTVGKESVFNSNRNLSKLLEITNYYRFYQTFRLSYFLRLPLQQQEEVIFSRKNKKPLVEIYSYSFMPNHFHFLIKQLKGKGISYFASNVQNSFAKFYNQKNNRVGGLFQNNFKAKRIHSNEEFIHVSRYIHLNHVTSHIMDFKQLKTSPWSSFSLYINNYNSFISKEIILNHFKNINRYISFVENQVNYQRTLKLIKNLLID